MRRFALRALDLPGTYLTSKYRRYSTTKLKRSKIHEERSHVREYVTALRLLMNMFEIRKRNRKSSQTSSCSIVCCVRHSCCAVSCFASSVCNAVPVTARSRDSSRSRTSNRSVRRE